jgi:glycosyltransferase involved in cell wall biosynthesis
MARSLLKLEGIIAVSQGVADDFKQLVRTWTAMVQTIYNPLDLDGIHHQATMPVDHPFFNRGPVILGVGALVKNKNFAMLLQAFSQLPLNLRAHLVILGDGKERPHLWTLAKALQIEDRFDLPGFVDNPYAWMAKSRLLAVTSRAEGFCNVLAEAQALGIPAVSTRCPGGPVEILDHGRYGMLVDIDDSAALKNAIGQTLANPPAPEAMRQAAMRFSADRAAERYLELFSRVDGCCSPRALGIQRNA